MKTPAASICISKSHPKRSEDTFGACIEDKCPAKIKSSREILGTPACRNCDSKGEVTQRNQTETCGVCNGSGYQK